MRLLVPTAAILLLAACGQPAPAPSNDVIDNAADSAATAPADNAATPPVTGKPDPEPPEPAPIPAKFRGNWAETKANCADATHHSRLTISGRTVRSPNYVLVGESFTFPAPNQFALEGKFEGSGEVGAAHYSINAAGNVLTDEAGGGAVRVRCG